jgi:[protein-PII] uridylyltransferase
MTGSTYAADLGALTDEKSLAAYVRDARAALRDTWQPQGGGRRWGQANAELMDAVLRRLFALAAERAGGDTARVALIAMGGYGHRVLAPFSDVDLTFLVDRDDDPPILRETFRLVMDVLLSGARVKIGYGYRHLSDIGKGGLDHQTQTALLDARLLAGDSTVFARFDQDYVASLQIADFLFSKETERANVRARAGNSPWQVEPDLKEGAGGLRDVQTALWMARARFHRSGDALWRELVRRKILTKEEMRTLQDGREHLYRLRHLLHLLAGDRRDQFTMSMQERAAQRLGFTDTEEQPAVELLMRRHYAVADAVDRLSEKVMQRTLDAPLTLGTATSGLSALRRTVVVTAPRAAFTDPLWPLAALEHCQRYELTLAAPAAEAIAETVASHWNTGFPPGAGERFRRLLGQSGDALASLRRMHATGLLVALLPELSACMTLIPYDPAHAATVGEHTLRVFGNLIRLRERPDEQPVSLREAFSALESPVTLLLAALLHDLGKQWPRTREGQRAPHEVTGAERAPEICLRLACPPEMTERITVLVRHHLLLAEVSRLRDMARYETIREVVRAIRDPDLLRMLYVLTWADTSAVGPGVWTDMTARLLDELYDRAQAALEGPEIPQDEYDREAEARRLEALRERLRRHVTSADGPAGALASRGGVPGADPDAVRAHIEAMPVAYLLSTPPEVMTLHLAMLGILAAGEADGGVVSDIRTLSGTAQTELTLVARDDPRPGLLAKVTGVLYAYDCQLHTAQVFTRPEDNARGIVLDTLVIDFRDRPLDRHLRGELASALRRVLSGEESLVELLARRRRPDPSFGPASSLRLDTSVGDGLALLDMTFPRAPGAVHALTATLSELGWDIHAARLSTWAGNARCAVYLSDAVHGGNGTEESRTRLCDALATADLSC